MIKCVEVECHGSSYIEPMETFLKSGFLEAELENNPDVGTEYQFRIIEMSAEELATLPEFTGF